MKKRIVFILIGLLLIGTIIAGAGILMSNMRGPGPDWDKQEGIAQPLINSGMRSYGSPFGVTIFGTNFDDSADPTKQGFVLNTVGGSSVAVATDVVNSGSQSLKFSVDAVANDEAGVFRIGSAAGIISKYGLSISAYPDVPLNGPSLSTLKLNLYCNFYGLGKDVYIAYGLKLSRQAGNTKKLFYRDASGNYVDTGITNLDDFFMSNNDGTYQPFWHRIKFVVDPTVNPPTYSYFEIDGHRFDLSAFSAQVFTESPTYQQRNYYQAYVGLINDEANAKVMHIDDFAISVSEPGGTTIALTGGGGGGMAHNLLDGSVHPDTLAGSPVYGDLVYANATSLWDRLPKGTDGNVLTMASGRPDWVAPGGTTNGVNGIGMLLPEPLNYVFESMTAMTANRIYLTRIILENTIKITEFFGQSGSGSPNAHWGAGLYTLLGNLLLVQGVTGLLGAQVAIPVTCTPTFIGPGVFWLAMTADAAGIRREHISYDDSFVAIMNGVEVVFGYTSTTSTAGVLPNSVALPPTAINVKLGPQAWWMLNTVGW